MISMELQPTVHLQHLNHGVGGGHGGGIGSSGIGMQHSNLMHHSSHHQISSNVQDDKSKSKLTYISILYFSTPTLTTYPQWYWRNDSRSVALHCCNESILRKEKKKSQNNYQIIAKDK